MWPQWTSMLSAGQWSLLALVPPAILALYFLKLKRQPLEVPSTYLWRKTIEDLRVNSLWQRLRQSLLLFLQLALVAMAILALLRPAWRSSELAGERFVFLIDNSASMAATDVTPTRLDEAKRRTSELIRRMRSGDVGMIVSFADTAQVVQHFTDDRKALQRAVNGIVQSQRGTNLIEALRVAAGLANPGRSANDPTDVQTAAAMPAELYLLSDGNFPKVEGFSLGNLKPTYIPIGEPDAANVGIVAFSTRINDEKPEQLQAFARLENHGPEDAAVELGLYLEGNLIDNQRVEIAAGQSAGAAFELIEPGGGVLELRAETGDVLPADDRAWAGLNRPRRGKVLLISDENQPLELALATPRAQSLVEVVQQPAATATDPKFAAQLSTAAYDLVIFDRCGPAVPEGEKDPVKLAQLMPEANTLWIGRLPPLPTWSAEPVVALPQIIDTDRAHPVMQMIEMGDVLVTEATPLKAPLGAGTLVSSHLGPIVAIAPREGYEDLVVGFELFGSGKVTTNWPVRRSFPLFILNTLSYLAARQQSAESRSVRPGETIALHSDDPNAKLTVNTPSQRRVAVRRGNLGAYNFSDTEDLGIYRVERGRDTVEQFAVNLFDSRESAVQPQSKVDIGYTKVAGQAAVLSAPLDLWKWLLGAALVVLLVEWYIYNRRVYI